LAIIADNELRSLAGSTEVEPLQQRATNYALLRIGGTNLSNQFFVALHKKFFRFQPIANSTFVLTLLGTER
jgi:hypothetical protein